MKVEATQITAMARQLNQVRSELHQVRAELAGAQQAVRQVRRLQTELTAAKKTIAALEAAVAEADYEAAQRAAKTQRHPSPGGAVPEWGTDAYHALEAASEPENVAETMRHGMYD